MFMCRKDRHGQWRSNCNGAKQAAQHLLTAQSGTFWLSWCGGDIDVWLVVDSEGYGLRFVQLGESIQPPLAAGETAYYTEFPFNNTQWRELVAISRAGVSLGTGDGQRTLFDLPSAPVVEVTVFRDGTPVTSGVEVDGATGSVEFVSPPANGATITASFVELANRPVAYMTASKHRIT